MNTDLAAGSLLAGCTRLLTHMTRHDCMVQSAGKKLKEFKIPALAVSLLAMDKLKLTIGSRAQLLQEMCDCCAVQLGPGEDRHTTWILRALNQLGEQ